MALFDLAWYCNAGDQSTTGYYAVAKWAAATTYVAGNIIRQKTAPAVGSERCYVCYNSTGGTGQSAAVTEPTFPTTRGGQVTDNTVKWQEITGIPALNGDLSTANMPIWVASTAYTLGSVVISTDGTKILLCTVAGTSKAAPEPTWAAYTTTGATTADNTATWVTIGDSTTHKPAAWGAPHARLGNVCTSTWFKAGNTCFVAANHAESSAAAINITPLVAHTSMSRIVCVNQAGSVPPVAADITTGATISQTGAGNGITFNPANGEMYVYGIAFKCGVGVSTSLNSINMCSGTDMYIIMDNCSFQLNNTGASNSSVLTVSVTVANTIIWNNCRVFFAVVTHTIDFERGTFIWRNGAASIFEASSAIPTNLLSTASNGLNQNVFLEGLDLSSLNTTLISGSAANTSAYYWIKDCKLHASLTFATPSTSGQVFQFIRSDNGATGYKSARYAYEGTETTETTIVRTGGAQDPAGQAQSRKIVTTANAFWDRPFQAEPYAIWNNTVGSTVNVTVDGTINSASLPKNDDIWIEVEYLGTASFPLGVFANSTKATFLTANANVASDGSAWGGGGSGAGWSPFKLTLAVTPQFAGYIYVRVKVGKASATYYIDPQVVLS